MRAAACPLWIHGEVLACGVDRRPEEPANVLKRLETRTLLVVRGDCENVVLAAISLARAPEPG